MNKEQTTEAKKMVALDAIRYEGASMSKACAKAGLTFYTIKKHMADDPDFNREVEQAMEERNDLLEDAAFERAVKGVVTFRKRKVGDEEWEEERVTYSDMLLARLMEGNNPDKFARRSKAEIGGPDGGPIKTDDTALAARLASFVELARGRKEQEETAGDE